MIVVLLIEKKFIDFIKKHYIIFSFIFVTIVALFLRIKMMDYESSDYIFWLKPWFDYLKENGGLFALNNYPGDYNAPYMTIMALLTYIPVSSLYTIKIVSIIFDFVLAFAGCKLVSSLDIKNGEDNKPMQLITYTLILFIPQVMFNSSMWAQCDAMYASFIVFALYYLIKEKYIPSFIFLGLAFAFKLQFIFILPLFIVLYIVKQKYSILHFLIIPAVNFILCIPAMIFGRSIKDIFMVYVNQTSTYNFSLSLNFPNIYNFINASQNDVSLFYTIGTIVTIVACLLILIYVHANKVKFNTEKTLLLGILFLVVVTYLLPGMHERYLFVGEILMLLYYIRYKKYLPMLVIMIICPLVTYTKFFNDEIIIIPNIWTIINISYLIMVVYFTKNALLELKK